MIYSTGFKVFPRILNNSVPSSGRLACPPPNYVRVKVDDHISAGNRISFGVAIRDENEKILVARVKRVGVKWNPDMEEAGAARYKIELAR